MHFFRLAAICMVLALISFTTYAASSSLLSLPTPSKTVYLLFTKMAKRDFNAGNIITSMQAYKSASPDMRLQMLTAQKAPLEAEYAGIDPKTQIVVIRTAVNIHAELSPRPGLRVNLNSADKAPASIYFPYTYADMNIALIPDRLEAFVDIPLKVPEATAAAAKIRDNAATMVIEMVPLSADARSPMALDGLDQWLLMTRIVSVAYYNQSMDTIWQWQAADYRRANAPSPLQDLKK